MKKILTVLLITITGMFAEAQTPTLYNPSANAKSDIEAAIKKAKKEGKHVLVQAGGNWCGWCIEFARFSKADTQIDSLINSSFVWYHLNWSKENKNEAIFAKYAYPQRFGFPVFIILDGNGKRIHTQNSEYLEDGKKSYNKDKVMSFLLNWTPKSMDPANFKD